MSDCKIIQTEAQKYPNINDSKWLKLDRKKQWWSSTTLPENEHGTHVKASYKQMQWFCHFKTIFAY